MDRLTLGRMQNPVRGFLHGGAAVASVAGLGILLSRAWTRPEAIAGAAIFGAALLIMFTVSSLYHSVPWTRRWKTRLQRVDHATIYLVVAGTFTPIAIASLEGATLIVGMASIWAIAITGIALKALLPEVKTTLSATLQMAMGWMAVIWMPQITSELGWAATSLIVLGGLCYSVGMVIFSVKRPRLFPRVFSHHELFHVLVVAGSSLHFAAVLLYAIPATV